MTVLPLACPGTNQQRAFVVVVNLNKYYDMRYTILVYKLKLNHKYFAIHPRTVWLVSIAPLASGSKAFTVFLC